MVSDVLENSTLRLLCPGVSCELGSCQAHKIMEIFLPFSGHYHSQDKAQNETGSVV